MEKILHIALGGVNWMRTFQTLQMDGSGCFALPTFCVGVHTAAKRISDRIRRNSWHLKQGE